MNISAARNTTSSPRDYDMTNRDFDRLREIVQRHAGIALSDAKRELVYGRLARRLRALNLSSFADYVRLLDTEQPAELQEMINAITTNLTSFFREEHHFHQLTKEVLPAALARRDASRRLRFWSAGCSTGEEPYSIAITLQESLGHLKDWDVKVLATDIDSEVVNTAKNGCYASDKLKGLSTAQRSRWFKEEGARHEKVSAAAELKKMITFKQLNLLRDWPMKGPLDAIFCRNVVIYFDKPTQRTLFDRMAELQEPGAWLFIGHSENLYNVTQKYKLVNKTAYRRV